MFLLFLFFSLTPFEEVPVKTKWMEIERYREQKAGGKERKTVT